MRRFLPTKKRQKTRQSKTAIGTFCGKKVQNTRDIVADFSVLLMSTDARSTSRDRLRAMPCQKEENERSEVKSTKTIRMSLSREQPPARVERAQQEQDYAASRSGHAGCRLFFLRCKRECGGLKPLPGAMPGFSANKRCSPLFACSHVRFFTRPKRRNCRERSRPDAGAVKRRPG